MKKILTLLFAIVISELSFSQIAIDTNWSADVKSVYLSPVESEMDLPVIQMRQSGEATAQLLLRFDILTPHAEHLRYRFSHCDAAWRPDGLDASEFFSGPADGSIDNLQSSFTTLRDYTNYHQLLPVAYGSFTASGNYILEVYPADNPDSVLLSRRFWVVEQGVAIDATAAKPTGTFGNVNRDQEVTVGVTPLRGSFMPLQADYYSVVVQQNRREDNRRVLPFANYSNGAMQYLWHAENVFAGGNYYRYFDLSNLRATMYHVQRIEQWGGEVFAFLQPEESHAKKPYSQYNSLNGGMKTNIRDRQNPHIESDYVWVNFSLPVERPFLDGEVHICGALTNYRLGDESRMDWNADYRAYTKRMYLKQGYYSYQLLFLPVGEHEGQTSVFEGDHSVMPNEYTVFVYYHAPGARYERLVGMTTVVSQ